MDGLDLNQFKREPLAPRSAATDARPTTSKRTPTTTRRTSNDWFVKGPLPGPWLSLAAELPGKCLHVAMAVWYMAGLKKQTSVPLTRQTLAKFHVLPDAGRWALKKLEAARLVAVERKPGCAPVVTIQDAPAGATANDSSVASLERADVKKAGRSSGGTPERP